MRISDWSSDLCSSDRLGLPVPSAQEAAWVIGMSVQGALYRLLPDLSPEQTQTFVQRYREHYLHADAEPPLFEGMADFLAQLHSGGEIGRASCGERGCQYG